MPVQAFRRLISLVAERETGLNAAPAGDGVLFPMGRLLARCDGSGFVPVAPRPNSRPDIRAAYARPRGYPAWPRGSRT